MPTRLTYDLHLLVTRLDRAAARLLQEEEGISYSRFLALLAVSRGASSQRDLASWLGITEPSVSRMTRVLAADGLLAVVDDPRGGNRRQLTLTSRGDQAFLRCAALLEERFADLIRRCDIPYEEYSAYTSRLLASLDGAEEMQASAATPSPTAAGDGDRTKARSRLASAKS